MFDWINENPNPSQQAFQESTCLPREYDLSLYEEGEGRGEQRLRHSIQNTDVCNYRAHIPIPKVPEIIRS